MTIAQGFGLIHQRRPVPTFSEKNQLVAYLRRFRGRRNARKCYVQRGFLERVEAQNLEHFVQTAREAESLLDNGGNTWTDTAAGEHSSKRRKSVQINLPSNLADDDPDILALQFEAPD